MNSIQNTISLLSNAGWYEGRDIRNHLLPLPLAKLLPDNVFIFFCSYGGIAPLVKMSDNRQYEKVDISKVESFFKNPRVCEMYSFEKYDENNAIMLERGEHGYIYYYSALVGTQLYSISDLADSNLLLMDRHNNFYVIDSVVQLSWIGRSFIEALEYLFYGAGDHLVLNEDKLFWMGKKNHPLHFSPPINGSLNSINPWC